MPYNSELRGQVLPFALEYKYFGQSLLETNDINTNISDSHC